MLTAIILQTVIKIYMKTIYLSLCLTLFFCFSELQAQNDIVEKQKRIKINIPLHTNIKSLNIINNQVYLHSVSTSFLINKNGKIKEKSPHNMKEGLYFDNENIFSIASDGKIFKSSKLLSDLSNKLLKDKKKAKYLTKSGDTLFSCFVDTTNLSYSNGIFKIKGNEYTLFLYIVGIPAGLCTENNYLWYLYNKSKRKSKGMLRKYDIKTGKLLLEIEVPVIEPIGLYVQSDLCYVYSNYSHEFITLKLGGK